MSPVFDFGSHFSSQGDLETEAFVLNTVARLT